MLQIPRPFCSTLLLIKQTVDCEVQRASHILNIFLSQHRKSENCRLYQAVEHFVHIFYRNFFELAGMLSAYKNGAQQMLQSYNTALHAVTRIYTALFELQKIRKQYIEQLAVLSASINTLRKNFSQTCFRRKLFVLECSHEF